MRFLFVTGITTLGYHGVLSAFENLQDISSNPLFGSVLGYTETEVQVYFSEYLERAASRLGLTISTVYERLQENYGGFSFDFEGQTRVFLSVVGIEFSFVSSNGFP